jgi:DNA mismatch repair protein MSH4
MSQEIDDYIDKDITLQKTALGIRHQKCFAVKAGVSGLLDVGRKTFQESTDDVQEVARSLAQEYSLPTLKLKFSQGIGYYLQLPIKDRMAGDLPDIFINQTKKGAFFHFTTLQITCLNERITESLNEVYALSEDIITDLLISIHAKLPTLYKLSEAIALMDLLTAVSLYAKGGTYVMPEFSNTLALSKARHPILEKKMPSFVPNDVYIDDDSNLQIVTGANMSGKTTYLFQISMILILGQIGCFVPCDYACISIIEKLLTRIGRDDVCSVTSYSSFTQGNPLIIYNQKK